MQDKEQEDQELLYIRTLIRLAPFCSCFSTIVGTTKATRVKMLEQEDGEDHTENIVCNIFLKEEERLGGRENRASLILDFHIVCHDNYTSHTSYVSSVVPSCPRPCFLAEHRPEVNIIIKDS